MIAKECVRSPVCPSLLTTWLLTKLKMYPPSNFSFCLCIQVISHSPSLVILDRVAFRIGGFLVGMRCGPYFLGKLYVNTMLELALVLLGRSRNTLTTF